MTTKKNAQDATRRNTQAANKRLDKLEAEVRKLKAELKRFMALNVHLKK